MRRVILESPYAAPDSAGIQQNLDYARACLRDCLERGEAPIASHLLYTQPCVLDDKVPEEREWGIAAGLAWADVADFAVFYDDRGWSNGMLAAKAHYDTVGIGYEERTLPGYVAPVSKGEEAVFTLRAWGEGVPHVRQLADELERIAPMVRTGFQAGDAMLDEDFDGSGWWDHSGFDDD